MTIHDHKATNHTENIANMRFFVKGHIKVSGTVDYIRQTHAIKNLSRIFRVDG